MEIQILLNPKLPNYGEFQAELSGEINALQRPGITITSRTAPPPSGTLTLGEVFQFILDNKDTIVDSLNLLTAVIQIVLEVQRRRNITPPSKSKAKTSPATKKRKTKPEKVEPLAIIIVGEHQLSLPCTSKQANDFVKKVGKNRKK